MCVCVCVLTFVLGMYVWGMYVFQFIVMCRSGDGHVSLSAGGGADASFGDAAPAVSVEYSSHRKPFGGPKEAA